MTANQPTTLADMPPCAGAYLGVTGYAIIPASAIARAWLVVRELSDGSGLRAVKRDKAAGRYREARALLDYVLDSVREDGPCFIGPDTWPDKMRAQGMTEPPDWYEALVAREAAKHEKE